MSKLIYFIQLFKDEKFYIISSPLQFINLVEYKNKFPNSETINKKVFVLTLYNSEKEKIFSLRKKLKLNYKFIILNNYFSKLIIYLILLFRSFINKKISNMIIGDFDNLYMKRIASFSKKTVVLDDGTNLFSFKKFLKIANKNYFFSFFDKSYFRVNNYLHNNFSFISQKVKNFKRKNIIIILGMPLVATNVLDEGHYKYFLEQIISRYKKKKLYYFPHPKENISSLKKILPSELNIIKSDLNVELFLIKKKILPKLIIGFNSTSLITIKKIFLNRIKLINYHLVLKKKDMKKIYYEITLPKFLKIILYIKKFLKIKTIKIRL